MLILLNDSGGQNWAGKLLKCKETGRLILITRGTINLFFLSLALTSFNIWTNMDLKAWEDKRQATSSATSISSLLTSSLQLHQSGFTLHGKNWVTMRENNNPLNIFFSWPVTHWECLLFDTTVHPLRNHLQNLFFKCNFIETYFLTNWWPKTLNMNSFPEQVLQIKHVSPLWYTSKETIFQKLVILEVRKAISRVNMYVLWIWYMLEYFLRKNKLLVSFPFEDIFSDTFVWKLCPLSESIHLTNKVLLN